MFAPHPRAFCASDRQITPVTPRPCQELPILAPIYHLTQPSLIIPLHACIPSKEPNPHFYKKHFGFSPQDNVHRDATQSILDQDPLRKAKRHRLFERKNHGFSPFKTTLHRGRYAHTFSRKISMAFRHKSNAPQGTFTNYFGTRKKNHGFSPQAQRSQERFLHFPPCTYLSSTRTAFPPRRFFRCTTLRSCFQHSVHTLDSVLCFRSLQQRALCTFFFLRP